MESVAKAIVLGIVEGLTEFLPISSTAHLLLANRIVDFNGRFAIIFDVVIQTGAVLAVVVYFFGRLWPFGPGRSEEERRAVLSLWAKTCAAVLPALCVGGLFGEAIQERLFRPLVIAVALILGGFVLLAVERRSVRPSIGSASAISYRTALAVGAIQCAAVIPGVSRSAATIAGAILLGASRKAAAEFSFFLAIPTIGAASVYMLGKHGRGFSGAEWTVLAAGFASAFLVALAVVAGFMGYVQRNDFKPFAYYRIVLGIVILFVSCGFCVR